MRERQTMAARRTSVIYSLDAWPCALGGTLAPDLSTGEPQTLAMQFRGSISTVSALAPTNGPHLVLAQRLSPSALRPSPIYCPEG